MRFCFGNVHERDAAFPIDEEPGQLERAEGRVRVIDRAKHVSEATALGSVT